MIATLLSLLVSATEARPMRHFALIVAQNQSVDSEIPALSFADDDGAKYFELFSAMGARVELLSVLDRDLQERFPAATAAARAPTERELSSAIARTFAAVAQSSADGYDTTFYFVFAGHGSVGPNQEGYLHLLDGKLQRRELFAQLLKPSPATWNHLIIDACNAYFFVEKRGGEDAIASSVRRFLATEDLRSYPNTGVIFAASSESRTHEWSRWRAGVFSHELRSALLGTADVDGDGVITYAEAAYSVEAANASVADPLVRLRVYARPPPLRVHAPLVVLADLGAPRLAFDGGKNGHYFVTDARGIRVLDLHPDGQAALNVALVGHAPFSLAGTDEAARVGERSGIEASYEKDLFARPFGESFLHGALAARGVDDDRWDGWYGTPFSPSLAARAVRAPLSARQMGAIASFSGALVLGGLAGTFYYLADVSFRAYTVAVAPSEVRALRLRSEGELGAAHTLIAAAGVAVVAGSALLLIDLFAVRAPVVALPVGNHLVLSGRF